MRGERLARAERLFQSLLDGPVADRPARLARSCADDDELRAFVADLLRLHDLEAGTDETASTEDTFASYGDLEETRLEPGTRLAGYEITGVLGAGGMGVVYEARQVEPDRLVAVKLLRYGRLSPRALRRFRHEADVLARLQHPAIAQVYEVGTGEVDGAGPAAPFFSMELVRGEPLDEYARKRSLGVRRRLELFREVCRGVDHAHQRFILHRDLKPSNILVTESGQPKILDFGIARALDDETSSSLSTLPGEILGTVPYMSPEQLSGGSEPDVRTDVFALGVVLYELLTGAWPHELAGRSLVEAIRIVREDEPNPIGRRAAHLRGDVETIVSKALSRDRDRRYPTVSELEADIGRHLDDRPIAARRPSLAYRCRKFATRHRGLVAGLLLAASALITGAVVAVVYAVREAEQAELAREEARVSRRVVEHLKSLYRQSIPGFAKGSPKTPRQILDESAATISDDLADTPLAQARLLLVIGNAYCQLREPDRAGEILRRALALLERHAEPLDLGKAEACLLLADGEMQRGHLDESRRLLERCLAIRTESPKATRKDLADCHIALGIHHSRCDELEPALRHLSTAVELLESAPGSRLLLASALSDAGAIQNRAGRYQEAADGISRALRIWDEAGESDHPQASAALGHLGISYVRLGRLDEAQSLFERALADGERVFGEDGPRLFARLRNLGSLYATKGDFDRATELLRRALAVAGPRADDDPDVLGVLGSLALIEHRRGALDAARELYAGVLSRLERAGRGRSLTAARQLLNLGRLHWQAGDHDEAEDRFEAAAEIREEKLGADHPEVAEALRYLARSLDRADDFELAAPLYERAMRIEAARLPAGDAGALATLRFYAHHLHRLGREKEAEKIAARIADLTGSREVQR